MPFKALLIARDCCRTRRRTATAVNGRVTDELLEDLAESRFLHVPLMNRVEGRLSSREQLERYLAVLVSKLAKRQTSVPRA